MKDNEGYEGVWRTIKGARVFIRTGETLDSAMERHNNQKKYTSKDIEPIRRHYSQNPVGYKLGDYYLLKEYYGLRTTEKYNWIISKKDHTALNYIERRKQVENGEIYININNFKEGKEKLIEIANNKPKKFNNRV